MGTLSVNRDPLPGSTNLGPHFVFSTIGVCQVNRRPRTLSLTADIPDAELITEDQDLLGRSLGETRGKCQSTASLQAPGHYHGK